MGQYWLPVNLTKKEFIDPHKMDSGLKLCEQLVNRGTPQAMFILLADMPEPRGGGDFDQDPIIGRWAGDNIAVVGDYADTGEVGDQIYGYCRSGMYSDVTESVLAVLNAEYAKWGI